MVVVAEMKKEEGLRVVIVGGVGDTDKIFIYKNLSGTALINTSLSLSLDTWHDTERVFNMIGPATGGWR